MTLTMIMDFFAVLERVSNIKYAAFMKMLKMLYCIVERLKSCTIYTY